MEDDQVSHQVSQRPAIFVRYMQPGDQAIVQLHTNARAFEDEPMPSLNDDHRVQVPPLRVLVPVRQRHAQFFQAQA